MNLSDGLKSAEARSLQTAMAELGVYRRTACEPDADPALNVSRDTRRFQNVMEAWRCVPRRPGSVSYAAGLLAVIATLIRAKSADCELSRAEEASLSLDALRYAAADERGETLYRNSNLRPLSHGEQARVVGLLSVLHRRGRNPFAVSYRPGTDAEVGREAAALARDAYTIAEIASREGYTRREGDDGWIKAADAHRAVAAAALGRPMVMAPVVDAEVAKSGILQIALVA
jgi:hypothetical protein